MKDIYLTRQAEILGGDNLKRTITVVGAGAIGSFTVLTLAKLGFSSILVYDDDVIDPENMNCQFYRVSDIGRKKVEALKDMVREFTGTQIKVVDGRIDHNTLFNTEVVISALDSMEARKNTFEGVMKCNTEVKFFVDARMAAEQIAMYAGRPSDSEFVNSYRGSLYADDDAVQERCTAKSTMYTVNLIAGLIGKTVKDYSTHNDFIADLQWSVDVNKALWFGETSGKLTL